MQTFLFTTLPSNDLGLLTRSLPIAAELRTRGHQVIFCSPAKSPSRLVNEAGFENLLPRHPLYHLMATELNFRGLYRSIKSAQFKRDFGNLFNCSSQLIRTVPTKYPPITSEIWNMDHMAALAGMLNENLVRTACEAMLALMAECQADVIVDFWNPVACRRSAANTAFPGSRTSSPLSHCIDRGR